MTPERAQEIIKQAQEKRAPGPWSDQLDSVMSREERQEVLNLWQKMPGYTCFVDALNRIRNGQGEAYVLIFNSDERECYKDGDYFVQKLNSSFRIHKDDPRIVAIKEVRLCCIPGPWAN